MSPALADGFFTSSATWEALAYELTEVPAFINQHAHSGISVLFFSLTDRENKVGRPRLYTALYIYIMFSSQKQESAKCLVHLLPAVSSLANGSAPAHTQFSSVTQSCPTLCDPMDCSTSGLLVHCQLPEFTQTHVQRVGDAIQPSHPLSSPSPPAFNLSQDQGLFQ